MTFISLNTTGDEMHYLTTAVVKGVAGGFRLCTSSPQLPLMTYNARHTDEAYFALFSAMEHFRQGPPVYILPLFQALSCSLLSIFLSLSIPPSTFPMVFQSRATEQSRVVGTDAANTISDLPQDQGDHACSWQPPSTRCSGWFRSAPHTSSLAPHTVVCA